MDRWIWQKPNWPQFRYNSEALLGPVARSHQLLGRLYQQVRSLGLNLELAAHLDALTTEALQTSAIEGEIEDPHRLRSSLANRLGLPTGGLPPPRNKENGLADMLLDATGNTDPPLTAERLFSWHNALFPQGYSGIYKITVAGYRPPARDPMRILSGPAGRERIHYVAPPAEQVPGEMAKFFSWWEETKPQPGQTVDFLLRSGIVHYWFVAIHPFEDGNGRIARALADLALAQGEGKAKRCYSISATIMENRNDYYAVLDRTSCEDGDLTEWLTWYLQIHAKAVANSLVAMEKVLWTARTWQKLGQIPLNERQRKAIGKMVEKGPGGFEGGLTRRKYVAMTRASEATAKRDLAELVSSGVLIPYGGGRASAYELIPEMDELPLLSAQESDENSTLRPTIAEETSKGTIEMQEIRLGLETGPMHSVICAAIQKKAVLRFTYEKHLRIVEPQAHGISTAGKEVLRAVQTGGTSDSELTGFGKLFEVAKMVGIEETGEIFAGPGKGFNPQDKGMSIVHCHL